MIATGIYALCIIKIMSVVIFLLFTIRLYVPEIRSFEFKNCHIVFIKPSSPPYGNDLKRGFARWEENKGYVWVKENIPSENFFIDKWNERIIFIDDITDCRRIHGWTLKIFDINTCDTTIYCIQTESKEDLKIPEEGGEVVISEVIYEDGVPSPRRYTRRGDTIFFYLKEEEKFLKHKEFKIYKNGEYFMSIKREILYFDIKNTEFGGTSEINEKFKWKSDVAISITVQDSLNFFEKLFLFDRIKRIFKEDKKSFFLLRFNTNSKINTWNVSEYSRVNYYVEFKGTEYLKKKPIAISYFTVVHNDSIYIPLKEKIEFIKSNSDSFINLVKRFEKIGKIDSFSKPSIGFDLKESKIISSFHGTLIKDKFYISIDLVDTSGYDSFYKNIKLKTEKFYKLLDLCMKNKKFKEDVIRGSKTHGVPDYYVNIHSKYGKFPPYLKNGEPVISIVIIRKPSFLEVWRKKFAGMSEREKKEHFEKRKRARKFVVYYLDEKGRLTRWERKDF